MLLEQQRSIHLQKILQTTTLTSQKIKKKLKFMFQTHNVTSFFRHLIEYFSSLVIALL